MIKNGQLLSVVGTVKQRDLGGLYQPTDKCTKTGHPVIDILRKKHPDGVVPDVTHFDTYPEDVSEECQTSMPVYCSEDDVTKAAKTR